MHTLEMREREWCRRHRREVPVFDTKRARMRRGEAERARRAHGALGNEADADEDAQGGEHVHGEPLRGAASRRSTSYTIDRSGMRECRTTATVGISSWLKARTT
jgi:hypothetical protein